jgi:hypothetical protein
MADNNAMKASIIRVSIMRCDPADFERFRRMMAESEPVLRPGIEAMPGVIAYYAGADAATSSLTNTSVWQSLTHAQQMDRFEPMLALGRAFAAAGARFDRPIMNHATLWRFGPAAGG